MTRILFLLIFLFTGFAGTAQTSEHTKYVFVKFDAYSVKEDKLIQSELNNEKIVYTCILSGILVIEVSENDADAEKRISAEIKKVTGLPSFQFVQGMSISDAENSCSTFRKPE